MNGQEQIFENIDAKPRVQFTYYKHRRIRPTTPPQDSLSPKSPRGPDVANMQNGRLRRRLVITDETTTATTGVQESAGSAPQRVFGRRSIPTTGPLIQSYALMSVSDNNDKTKNLLQPLSKKKKASKDQ